MNLKEALEMQRKANETKLAIRIRKGNDYAKPEADTHANFRVMADLARVLKTRGYEVDVTKPEGVAMWHLLHKVVRILNLWNSGIQPENESLDDTHFDLENYSELAREIYTEERRRNQTNEKE